MDGIWRLTWQMWPWVGLIKSLKWTCTFFLQSNFSFNYFDTDNYVLLHPHNNIFSPTAIPRPRTDPCFHYTTNAAVSRLRLPWWSEPFTVALADLLLDVPFDILGIKYLWWTWHDTDPNIFDRTYSVPLTRCALIRMVPVIHLDPRLSGQCDETKPTWMSDIETSTN